MEEEESAAEGAGAARAGDAAIFTLFEERSSTVSEVDWSPSMEMALNDWDMVERNSCCSWSGERSISRSVSR